MLSDSTRKLGAPCRIPSPCTVRAHLHEKYYLMTDKTNTIDPGEQITESHPLVILYSPLLYWPFVLGPIVFVGRVSEIDYPSDALREVNDYVCDDFPQIRGLERWILSTAELPEEFWSS